MVRQGHGHDERRSGFRGTALGKRAVSDEEIVTKFRGIAGTVLSAQHVEELVQRVEGIEDLRSIGELTALLTTRRAP